MAHSQLFLDGLNDVKPKSGSFPVFYITNLVTGEFAKVCEQSAFRAIKRLGWSTLDCETTKNGYSNQFGKIFNRTTKRS